MPTITPLLESKIKGLTTDPGVYLMKDEAGSVLYVGKAKNLKARVSTYFKESVDKGARIEWMIRKIADFEVVLTDNEIEALILEFNLIKKFKPRFNVVFRDDKSYPYVRIDSEHPFPRLEYIRKVKKDGARYFGPYVSSFQVKDVLRWAQKAFKLRDCSDNEFRNRARPCILYQMQQCSAPCVGYISESEYAHGIETVLKLLEGKTKDVIKDLTLQMEQAAEGEKFEKAASLRDRIRNIEEMHQEQKITDPEASFDRDYVQFARGAGDQASKAVIVLMALRDGRTVGVFQFPFEDIDLAISDAEFLFGFLAQYYLARFEEAPQLLPKEVLIAPEVEKNADEGGENVNPIPPEYTVGEQSKILSRALGKKVDFRIPKRGEAANLLAMVKKTAEYHLNELNSKVSHAIEDLIDVQKKLHLDKFPKRIECYDISHFQGEGTVASRAVFIEGRPEKELYRHYHIREVEGVDDFKSLREVIGRRFENDQSQPDLVVIDGGKGQLAQAIQIFSELGVSGVELVSIAKAKTKSDFKEEEVESTSERIFKPNQKNYIALRPGTGAFRVLTQIRDESHRFAITFHRKIRDQKRS